MAEKKEYRVRVCGVLVPVTQEVYQVFYQTKRHAKTLYEKDERNGLISYDGMDTEDTLGEEMIPDRDAISVEDAAIADALRKELRRCLAMLPQQEKEILFSLYFEGKSERICAQTLGISQKAVNKRRHKALAALRHMIKI